MLRTLDVVMWKRDGHAYYGAVQSWKLMPTLLSNWIIPEDDRDSTESETG